MAAKNINAQTLKKMLADNPDELKIIKFKQSNMKALVLFSGGLDSQLAVKILQAQDIAVEAVCFVSPWFKADKAEQSAQAIGIKLHTLDLSSLLLPLIKNPPSGYGKNMNPCIDCHALMIRTANEQLNSPDINGQRPFAFIATGEVLGQRPFSQNKEALLRVQKLAGIEILRPLSAKLLPETEIEKSGLVNRDQLLDIVGRNRERQMELAAKYQIKDYPSPAGGCLLTDPAYGQRLNLLLTNWPEFNPADAELIKNGRTRWITLNLFDHSRKALALIGRNQAENENLERLAKTGDIVLKLTEINGPSALIRFPEIIAFDSLPAEMKIQAPAEAVAAARLTAADKTDLLALVSAVAGEMAYYAVKARGKEVNVKLILSF